MKYLKQFGAFFTRKDFQMAALNIWKTLLVVGGTGASSFCRQQRKAENDKLQYLDGVQSTLSEATPSFRSQIRNDKSPWSEVFAKKTGLTSIVGVMRRYFFGSMQKVEPNQAEPRVFHRQADHLKALTAPKRVVLREQLDEHAGSAPISILRTSWWVSNPWTMRNIMVHGAWM